MKLPTTFTLKNLMNWGGEFVFKQAESLCKRGVVRRVEQEGDLLSGIIVRENGNLQTKLRFLPNGKIESLCPCIMNQRDGQICPHVVAIGLLMLMRTTDPRREEKYQAEKRHDARIQAIPSSRYIQRSASAPHAFMGLSTTPQWVEQCQKGEKVHLHPFFLVHERWLPPSSISFPIHLSTTDEDLLSVLEDICQGPPTDTIHLAPDDFLGILHLTRQRPIQIGGHEKLLVHKTAVNPVLRVRINHQTGALQIRIVASLPDDITSESSQFLISSRRGYLYTNHTVYPLQNLLPLPYHPLYKDEISIPRSEVITFLKRDIPQLSKQIQVQMELTPDLFEQIPGEPIFHLQIRGSQASLRASLQAAYGQYLLPAGQPAPEGDFSIPDPEDILRYHVRNPEAEARAIAELAHYGFFQDGQDMLLTNARKVMNFLGSGFRTLDRKGWKIKFTGKIAEWIDTTPTITPIVHIRQENAGEFDVGYHFNTPAGTTFTPSEIQRAINMGESHLQRDGKTFLIDCEAVSAMRSIFDDCKCRLSKTPGHFLLPNVYAPFVQSSLFALEGIDVEMPDAWREKALLQNRKGNVRFTPVPLGALETTLRPYQKEGVYWLRFLENARLCGLLADEMGLGKTLQTLCWLSLERTAKEAQCHPALIVCPTSLVGNWDREAEKFVPHLKRLVLSGPDRKERFSEMVRSDLIITSYALLRRDQALYVAQRFSAMVLDEAQHIKNRSTQNAIAAKNIHAENKLVLTGTPIENSVADLWSIMDFLMPDYLGPYDEFKLNYQDPIAEAGLDGVAAQEKLRRKLHPFLLRRVKRDVAKDLPEKIIKISYCPLSPDQRRVYDSLMDQSRRIVKEMVKARGFEKSRFEILAILLRLRQTCCHLGLLTDRPETKNAKEPSAKLETFMELLDEAMDGGHRILVFSQFVKMLGLIREELNRRGIPYCYLDGSTKDRLEQCQRFNLTPSIPVFLISLKAGGTGLNLTGADMVVHFDPWWNPAVEDQATDRAHRIGQKRTVYSIKLITENSVEEKVLAMQQKKQAVIQATIGTTDQAIMNNLTFNDIKDLLGM